MNNETKLPQGPAPLEQDDATFLLDTAQQIDSDCCGLGTYDAGRLRTIANQIAAVVHAPKQSEERVPPHVVIGDGVVVERSARDCYEWMKEHTSDEPGQAQPEGTETNTEVLADYVMPRQQQSTVQAQPEEYDPEHEAWQTYPDSKENAVDQRLAFIRGAWYAEKHQTPKQAQGQITITGDMIERALKAWDETVPDMHPEPFRNAIRAALEAALHD